MQPKLRLFSDGKHTYAEICGKSIGNGVQELKFSHIANVEDGTLLELRIDLNNFKFEKDGFFDEAEKRFMNIEPPNMGKMSGSEPGS